MNYIDNLCCRDYEEFSNLLQEGIEPSAEVAEQEITQRRAVKFFDNLTRLKIKYDELYLY
jgi:hypothetical protein